MSIIETHGLTKFYGNVRGIEGVDMSVQQGEVFGFIGPNGAGKSTTIRLLLNLIFPTEGRAEIMGKDIINESRQIHQRVGYLPSELHFYSKMSVQEILEYSASFYNTGWRERCNELSERFEVNRQRALNDLSTGNKKKVGLLLALLHQPALLILDEPTSGLDPLMQHRFFETIREEQEKGTTVFFSSHVLKDVQRLCDRVAILKEGRVLKIEHVKQLQQKNLKKCRIRWEGETPDLKHDHIENLHRFDGGAEFSFTGPPGQLIRFLEPITLVDLDIEEPDLEEIFLHYYQR